MKRLLITLASFLIVTHELPAAVSFSGYGLYNVEDSNNVNLNSGLLALLVVDAGGDGFLNATLTTGNPISSGSISSAGLSTDLMSTFAGDTVVARMSSENLGFDTWMAGTLTLFENVTAYQNKNFAIVWFETMLSSTTGNATGKFGIARASGWTMPGVNSGDYTYGGNFGTITLGSTATSSIGSVAFATNGTTFTIIPEPSISLLGLFTGGLLLMRRRRTE